MKKIFSTLLVLFYIWATSAQAQTVYNNDCINVFLANRFICGNGTFANDNLNGKGAVNDFGTQFQNYPGCLLTSPSGFVEAYSAWYAFKIQTSGTLALDITPLASNDYDFAIFGPNTPCHALGTPIRCSYASPKGPPAGYGFKTGLNFIEGAVSEPASGTGYVKYMDVVAGQTYYMLINNWSNNSSGFSLTWGGTAKLAISTSEFTHSVSCNAATFNNASISCDGTLGYEWDFGDGSPVTSNNFIKSPRHYYQATGTYTVTLKTIIATSTTPANVGVIATSTRQVTITKVPPVIQIANVNDSYCVTAPAFTMTGTPAGGTLAIKKNQVGNFVDGANFDPAALGVGKHEVRYTYQDPTDLACLSVRLKVVEVFALPTLDLNAIESVYCVASPPVTLVGSPAGGSFKVNGTPATQINPSALGAGNHTLTYDYTNPTSGCSNSTSKTFVIHPTPTLSFTNVKDAYCLAGSPFTMQATPAGGSFTINGVLATEFNIGTLGIGTHIVKYDYTSPQGCSNSLSKNVQIADKPTITFVGLNPQYCTDVIAFNLQATPSGGTFKVNNTPATQLNPSALGAGIYTIEYSYIDPTDATCFNTGTAQVEVKNAATLAWAGVLNSYCVSDNITVSPVVNITYASGATDIHNIASFNPATNGVGNITLTHTVTDPITNCVSTITKQVTINALPTLAFVDLADEYCQQSFPVTLKANPAGGTFSIDGAPATILTPRDHAVGDILLVRYDYTDAQTCSNFIEQEVEITPASAFTPIVLDLDICPQPTYWLEAMTLAEENAYKAQGITPVYYWTNATGSLRRIAITEPSQSGNYEVTVRDQAGCPIAQKSFTLKVDCEPKLFVPTAFTPNTDGKNEVLQIFGEDFIKLDFKVYNRWGELIFTARSKAETWDGNIKGRPAPAGIYAWSATFENTLKRGEVVRKQGQFSLIR